MWEFFFNFVFFQALQGQINSPNKSSSKHGKMGHKRLHPLKHKCTFKAEEVENSIIRLKICEMKLNL